MFTAYREVIRALVRTDHPTRRPQVMRKRPNGSRYRNLTARGSVIYYDRVLHKGSAGRIKFSTRTSDWDLAVAIRHEYERRKSRHVQPVQAEQELQPPRRLLWSSSSFFAGAEIVLLMLRAE